jgi:hypothetical protein
VFVAIEFASANSYHVSYHDFDFDTPIAQDSRTAPRGAIMRFYGSTQNGGTAGYGTLFNLSTSTGLAPFVEAQTSSGKVGASVRYVNHEKLVELIPCQKFSYIIVDGILHDYKGDVTLTPSLGRGTEIEWQASFRMSLRGAAWFMKLYLTHFMQRAVCALANYAEALEGRPADSVGISPELRHGGTTQPGFCTAQQRLTEI